MAAKLAKSLNSLFSTPILKILHPKVEKIIKPLIPVVAKTNKRLESAPLAA